MASVAPTSAKQQSRLVSLLSEIAREEGIRPTALDGVRVMRASQYLSRRPVLYDEPCVVIVAQGRKRGFLGGQVFTYDPNSYLVLSVPLPFECETETGRDGPMLALKVRIDMAVLGELLARLPGPRPVDPDAPARAIFSTQLDATLGDVAVRLLEAVRCPADTAVLGPQIIREMTYRVLGGVHGDSLRAFAALHGRLAQVHRALQRIHADYATPLDVTGLADDVSMSASAFFHHFKAVTATSPLQYIKSVRLHKARLLMAHDRLTAASAAAAVGYESPSQFSREFKRFFGASPLTEATRLRDTLGLDRPPRLPVDAA